MVLVDVHDPTKRDDGQLAKARPNVRHHMGARNGSTSKILILAFCIYNLHQSLAFGGGADTSNNSRIS
jgi:hypothetical protein